MLPVKLPMLLVKLLLLQVFCNSADADADADANTESVSTITSRIII